MVLCFIGGCIGFCFGTAFAFATIAFGLVPTMDAEVIRVSTGMAQVMTILGCGLTLLIINAAIGERLKRWGARESRNPTM